MIKKWYVAHTYSGHEQKARRYLESAVSNTGMDEYFGDIKIPTEEVVEMKQGKRTTSTKKFLPGYILVEMTMTKETQHLVTSTPGVTSFVGSGGKPAPLSQDEVNRVMGQMDRTRTAEITEVPFRVGDPIKVIDGPFNDFSGVNNGKSCLYRQSSFLIV